MANGGPNDNGSQFFFTLGRCDELNKKNTIFGKVRMPQCSILIIFTNMSGHHELLKFNGFAAN